MIHPKLHINRFKEILIKTLHFCQNCTNYLADPKINMEPRTVKTVLEKEKQGGASDF